MDAPELLHAKEDTYGGVIIEEGLPQEIAAFAVRLTKSLSEWRQRGKRGIWLKIPIELSHLIVVAVDVRIATAAHTVHAVIPIGCFGELAAGFQFHHAEPKYVMMTKWLPTAEVSTLPRFASYYVGCGGFVLNDKNEILVVQEKNGPAAKLWWKMPGGAADPGEELHEAAKREVFEETGIRTEVVSLLCFRTQHDYQFGKSDMYFLFKLKPTTTEITKCEREIADAKWMSLEEFCNLPYYKGLWKAFQTVMLAESGGTYAPWSFTALPTVVRRGTNFMYHSPAAKF